mgnify:CR=1 FL=1
MMVIKEKQVEVLNFMRDSGFDLIPKEISDKEVQAGAVFYPPTIRSAAHLLNGTNGNAQLSKQVTLEILQCRDGAKKCVKTAPL